MMPCYFIGTLSRTLTLRAAFTSSTYLLSQIPGPGRSSDDDLLNLPDPLFKGAHQAFVRTRARGHRFAVLRPASDDALLFYWDSVPNYQFPRPPFQGGDQGLRAFHRRLPSLLANSGPASDDALLVPLICKNYLSVIPFSTVLSISPWARRIAR